MKQGTLIAERYALHDRLGSGAMGEVWRAQDTRFESRWVAVKFLREDDTLKADAQNRERLTTQILQQESRGPLTPSVVFDAVGNALSTSNGDGLREKIRARFGAGPITPAGVTALFDELVVDPAFNDNARMRAKLRRLFRDEANAVANLRHDNIVSIFDYGDHEGSPYLVMDYIEGRTLHQVIEGKEPLSQARRLRLMEDLCAGLGYAHRRKLVHRDIKPANLIIDSSTDSLKILDFGVVRRLGTDSTVGIPVGTFCYMSPEQTKGAATLDQRSDIFAVGLVFYELMSGKKAFPPGRGVGDLVARIQREPPPSLRQIAPDVSVSIEDVITKAVAKQPDDRYQDLTLMEREIAKVRAKIEAEDSIERTKFGDDIGEATIVKPRPAIRPGADLLQSAERAFATGDDNAVVELCNRALAVNPSLASAATLRSQAEARQRQSRAKTLLVQAEQFLVRDDLASAKASLDEARELTPSDPAVTDFDQKLQAVTSNRVRPAPPPPPAPPVIPPAVDPVTELIPARPISATRIPAQAAPPAAPPPEPPSPPAPPPSEPEQTIEMTLKSVRLPDDWLSPPAPAPPPVQAPTVENVPTPRASTDVPIDRARSQVRADTPRVPADVIPDPVRAKSGSSPVAPTDRTGSKPDAAAAPPAGHAVASGDFEDATLHNVPVPPGIAVAPRDRGRSRVDADGPRTAVPGAAVPPLSVSAASASAANIPAAASARVSSVSGAVSPKAVSSTGVPSAKAPPPTQPPTPVMRAGSNPLPLLGGIALVIILAIVAYLVLRPRVTTDVPAVVSDSTPSGTTAPLTTAPPAVTTIPPNPVTTTVPADTPTNASPADTTVAPVEPGVSATLSRIVIDVRPWARVRIVPAPPAAGQPATPAPAELPAEPVYVPFTIDLPPGDYVLEAENGGLNRNTTFPLKVAPAVEGRPPTFFTRSMPGFNATKIVDALLSRQ